MAAPRGTEYRSTNPCGKEGGGNSIIGIGGPSIETHRRLTVGLVLDRPESGPYQHDLLEGAHRKAVARDHNLLVFPASTLMGDNRAFAEWRLGLSSQHPLDGLIVATASLAAWGGPAVVRERLKLLKGLPMVSIGEVLEGIPSIVLENGGGLRALLDHVLGHHGRKHPVFLSGPPSSFDARERFREFREALHRHGIADSHNQVFQGDFLFSGGVEAVKYFWDQQESKPDLVVCANDNMAFGVLHELHARGIRVPDDVTVTGFDDVAFSDWLESPLATVRQPLMEVGELAVSMVFGEKAPAQVTVPTVAVFRRSCGCVGEGTPSSGDHLGHQLSLYFQTAAAATLESRCTQFAQEYQDSGRFSTVVGREVALLKALGMPWWFLCHSDPEGGQDLTPRHLHLVWDSGRSDDLPVKSPTGKSQGFPDFLGLVGRWTAVQIDLTVGLHDNQLFGVLVVEYSAQLREHYEWLRVRFSEAVGTMRTTQRLKHLNEALQEAGRKLEELSITDEMTGCYNRRGFLTLGLRELASCRRQAVGLWVFFIDLDGLKQINDQWGHEAGDEAIAAFAQVLVASMRTTDLMARLGGDEFTLLASHADESVQGILQVRLNQHLEAFNRTRTGWQLSYSLGGVYSAPDDKSSLTDLMKRADVRLYQEKQLKRHGS